MVLDDVAQGAGLVVERPPPLDAEIFGHRDLDALEVLPIPHGLEKRGGETEKEQVLDRVLAQILVDAEDVVFAEALVHDRVQRPRGRQVPTERLLDDDAPALGTARLPEVPNDALEEAGRNRQIVSRVLRVAELPA